MTSVIYINLCEIYIFLNEHKCKQNYQLFQNPEVDRCNTTQQSISQNDKQTIKHKISCQNAALICKLSYCDGMLIKDHTYKITGVANG